jgi:signal transduction histidine kinase
MRSIEDCRHGRGIRDTDINNIFNRSQRSRTDSDGAVAGTGLNLAIRDVKQKRHRGE